METGYKIKEEKLNQNNKRVDGTMRSLNFHVEERIDGDFLTKQIEELPWGNICERADAIEIIESLLNRLGEVCIENVPRRNKGGKERGVPKEIRI